MKVELYYHACSWLEAIRVANDRAKLSRRRQRITQSELFAECWNVESI